MLEHNKYFQFLLLVAKKISHHLTYTYFTLKIKQIVKRKLK